MLGGNDLDSAMYQEAVFLDKLKALYTSKIAYVEILPRKGEGVHLLYEERRLRANSNIKRWCMEDQVASFVAVNRRVIFFTDSVHLNRKGYGALHNILKFALCGWSEGQGLAHEWGVHL